MRANDIRSSFLKYFGERGHRVVPSSPLVPGDDLTLLFTNAGMNQFKDVFLGREKRDYARATTAQKVMRVSGKHNDLDNVGPSHRHHTFFEMLGNFSFGDYFKKEALPYAWGLLTDVWKMDPKRLVVSIFKGEAGIPRDNEAYDVWRRLGVPADRILELGTDDNFWQMGDTGPCGRCSEIYYIRGGSADPEIEIWNNVFMEFERTEDGVLTPLPAPSIDTGMGFERITSVLQRKESNYETDIFTPLLADIGTLSAHRYGGTMSPSDISMRVVADHVRATTFLIADGVIPSNEFRGYVLRKIMRRAMRHGKHLGFTQPFLHKLVHVIDREMGDAYPEVRRNREMVEKTILAEEKRFDAVLTDGLPRLEAEIAKALETPERTIPGDVAFRLYDTFGVPYEFVEDTAATQDVRVDKDGYERAMDEQRGKGRAHSAFKARASDISWIGSGETFRELEQIGDKFEGYTTTCVSGTPIVALFSEAGKEIDNLGASETGYVVLGKSPFYLEAGGQVSDSGWIRGSSNEAVVDGLTRHPLWPRLHHVRVTTGTLRVRDIVTADVDAEVRNATRRNHTATHLLHAALRDVLGTHVKQAGSLVAPDRLRFDFVHFQPVTRDELDRIERIVNEQITRNTPVTTEVRSTEEAIAAGAMALFGEKYGDQVRVVSVPGFSMELCGGTHVSATGDIGFFAIVSEGGVAAGVRRIEAFTGAGAVAWAQQQRAALGAVLDALRAPAEQAIEAIEKLQAEGKRLAREVSQLKTKLAMGGGGTSTAGAETVDAGGVKLARRRVADLDKDALRGLADSLKAQIKSGVVVIASESDGKVQIVASVTPDLTGRVKAGDVVKELAPIVGGKGGGRPDFAEAGGKQPEKIDEMLASSEAIVKKLVAAGS
jgi:alanyl-tRNA synthetase